MEARALTTLVDAVLARAWRRDSRLHGESHWRCVAATGLELGAHAGADRILVFCFGLLHDARRENDSYDPGHGPRAAMLAGQLRAEEALPLDEARFVVLAESLRLHADGLTDDDPTIGTCWDADRLHLPRVHVQPDPALLSTSVARAGGALHAATSLREAGPPSWAELVRVASAGR